MSKGRSFEKQLEDSDLPALKRMSRSYETAHASYARQANAKDANKAFSKKLLVDAEIERRKANG